MTNLFFDDYRIVSRDNVIREQGQPTLIPESVMCADEDECFAFADPTVLYDFQSDRYTMYAIPHKNQKGNWKVYGVAYTSTDLIHWEPRNTAKIGCVQDFSGEYIYDNQFLCRYYNNGIVTVLLDEQADSLHRYKAIALKDNRYGSVENLLLTSPDGIHWEEQKGIYCHPRGAEGIGSVFWSDAQNSWILTIRPYHGERRVCIYQTKDFKEFTEPSLAIWGDALDEPLSETYGLKAFPYKGWYLGFLHIYHTLNQNSWKYLGGNMDFQLAYSTNGLHWQRYLRKPFIDRMPGLSDGMIFGSPAIIGRDGDIYIVTACSTREHGYVENGVGAIATYKLREDGFSCLTAEAGKVGRIFTRTILLHTGEIDFNIKAEKATWALYDSQSNQIDGFGHEDCIPFSGDEKHYVPQFKNGKRISDLMDRVFSIEIKFEGGSLFAYSGEFTNMSQWEVDQYMAFKKVPEHKGIN